MDHMKRSSYLRRFTVTALISLLMIVMGSTTASAGVKFTQDYEASGVTADWTAAQSDRYSVGISGDETNHYLLVSSVGTGGNGTTLTSTSLNGKLASDVSEFSMSFDLKLIPGNNQQPNEFIIRDGGAGNVLHLVNTAVGSTTWQINGSTDQTIVMDKAKWYSFHLDVLTKDLILLTVTDKDAGTEIFSRQLITSQISTMGLGNMIFYTKRYYAGMAIDNVKVSTRAVVNQWDFAAYANTVEDKTSMEMSSETCTIGSTDCVKAAGIGEGLAVQNSNATSWLFRKSPLSLQYANNGPRVFGIVDLQKGDIVAITLNKGTAFTSAINGTLLCAMNNVYLFEVNENGNFGVSIGKQDQHLTQITVLREDKAARVSFSKGNDAEVLGEEPEDIEVLKGAQFASPANTSLYKSGFTLTGWNDGENTTACGDNMSVSEDATFTAVFTQNNIIRQDITAALEVPFNNIGWTEAGTESYHVAQASFNGESQDVAIKVDGKTITLLDIIPGTKIAVPAGTIADYSATDVTISGDTLVYNGSASSLVITYEGSATSTSIVVKYPRTGKPVVTTDLNDVYVANVNGELQLSATFIQADSYQWYSNTTASKEGAVSIANATTATYSVPTNSIGTTYYYCEATNAIGTVSSNIARVAVNNYVTFDFKNWSADDAELGNLWQWNTDANGNRVYEWVAKGSYSGWAQQPLLYPYAMAGYIGLTYGEFALVNGTGLYDNNIGTGRDRPVNFYDLKAGDVLVLRGTNLLATDVYDAGNNGNGTFDILINDAATEAYVIALTDGHLSFMRGSLSKNRVLEYAMVPNKYAPALTQDLDGLSYTIARGETKTFSVAATANDENAVSYQWYRNTTNSNKGGTQIDGATSATYTTAENESYYYYCVVSNSVTGASVVTTNTTHVQCKPQVSYVNNDADAIGDVPATKVIEIGGKFTVESRNYQLLKPGYTLTGWTDGTNTYEFGKSYDIVNDIVLNPVFRANEQSISAITKVTTVTWPFATNKDAPTVNWTDGETHVLAAQQAVTGELQDFGAKVASTGFATGAATATVAEGTTIKIPMKYGTTIELFTSGETPSAKVLTTDLVTPRNMTVDGSTLTYTYKGGNNELTINLGAGTYDSLVVHYVPTGMPVFAKDLESNYYLETGQDSTLTVEATEGVTFQWYRNTTHSNEGGTKIEGATSASYKVGSTTDKSEYYYVTITNNYGTVTSTCAAVDYFTYKTLNFMAWDDADAGTYATGKRAIRLPGGTEVYNYFYPYGLAGYVAVQNIDVRIRTNNTTQGIINYGVARYVAIPGMKTGQKITLTGGFDGNVWFEDNLFTTGNGAEIPGGAKYKVVAGEDRTVTITVLTDGAVCFQMARDGNHANRIDMMTLPDKYPPVITKDLDATYVVDKDEELELSVEAELAADLAGHSLAYQWYSNTSNSNKGGTAIEGATSADYTIEKVNKSAYYYCLVSNTATGAITPSSPAAVGFYLDVAFANNDADAYGEAPKTVKVQSGLPVTMPKNQTLIKDGYTLTGWTDGKTTTAIGKDYVPQNDVILNPVFTKNADNVSLQKRTDEMGLTWQFVTLNGSAEYNNNASANVQQVIISNDTIDVGIKMTKGDNQANAIYAAEGWMAANNGDFTLPVVKNARVEVTVRNEQGITINGTNIAYDAVYGAQGAVKYAYIYTGRENEITLNVGNNYIKNIRIVYPLPELLATNAPSYDVLIENAKAARKSAVITLTGSNLEPGSTVTLKKDDKGSNITVDSDTYTVDSNGNLSQQILVTYSGTTVLAKDSTVLTFVYSEDTQVAVKVFYGRTSASTGSTPVTEVSTKTVWDWSGASSTIQLVENEVVQNVYVSFRDIELSDGQSWPEGVTAANLAGAGTYYANNTSKCFDGKELYFKTKCKGTIDVVFSASSANNITLAVNGENTAFTATDVTPVTATSIPVSAGDVLITAHTTGLTTGEQSLRIYKVTFTPDANKPDITLDKTTSSFTLAPSKNVIYPDGDPSEEFYYTIDGTDPVVGAASTTKYPGAAVPLISNCTIKAIAVAPNKNKSDVDSLLTDMKTYKLNFGVYPSKSGKIVVTPVTEGYEYTENATVTLEAKAGSGYGFSAWATSHVNIANKEFFNQLDAVINVTIYTESNEYLAVFEQGKTVTVNYDVQNPIFYDINGARVNDSYSFDMESALALDYNTENFKTPIVSNSIFTPGIYPYYAGFIDHGPAYTLMYWQDQNGKKYNNGSNLAETAEGKEYTLTPVFMQNKGGSALPLENRKSGFDVKWDFRHSEYCHPLTLAAGKKCFLATNTLMTHTDGATQEYRDTVDVAIEIDGSGVTNTNSSFATAAFTNENDENWASISSGVKINIPAAYGAKITLATYKPIIPGTGGTKINGNAPDNVYQENIPMDGDAYLYTWTIRNTESVAELVIGDLDYAFYRYLSAHYDDTEITYLKLSSNNEMMGTVDVRSTNNENDHGKVSDLGIGFNKNTSVTLVATRNRYYELKYWIDSEGTKFFPNGTYQRASDEDSSVFDKSEPTEISGIPYTKINKDTLELTLKHHYEIQAVFGPRQSYTINFMSAEAAGDALPVQTVEIGEKFDMPQSNYNLYKEGYTLQYYISADSVDIPGATHYQFGRSYEVANDLLLMPVFTLNSKTVYDIEDAAGKTVTWNINHMNFNYSNSNGRMVAQLPIDNDNTIDVQCYFSTRNKDVYYRTNSSGLLELSAGATIQTLSTSNCVFKVNSAETQFQNGDITIDGDNKLSGAVVSKDVTKTSNSQTITFNTAATVQSISVTYKKITKDRKLASVTIDGTSLNTEKLATLNESGTYTYSCTANDVDEATGELPAITAEPLVEAVDADKASVVVTPATLQNPVAVLKLQLMVAKDNYVTLRTFSVNYNVTGQTSAPTLKAVSVNGVAAENGSVSGAQNTSGVITLDFNQNMVARNVVIDSNELTASVKDSVISLCYWSLTPDTAYTFTIPANTFENTNGVKYGSDISVSFTTSASSTLAKKLFNYIVTHKVNWNSATQAVSDTVQIVPDDVIANIKKQKDIDYGTLEDGLTKANAAGGTERYRIFVPDGQYNMRGINPITSTENVGLRGKDDNGNFTSSLSLTLTDYPEKVFYNGRSVITSNNISIIGQSQDSTVIYSDPRVAGQLLSPLFTISNNVEGTYMQDFTLENRFCNSQGDQPDAGLVNNEEEDKGGAPSIRDNGYHTVAKYVTLKAHDATYVSDPGENQMTDSYYEDCQLWGMLYPIFGNGQAWWQNPTVVLRYNTKRQARLSSLKHYASQAWGYILKDGVFTAENSAARGKNEGKFYLGTRIRYSPVQTLLNMKFDLSSDAGGFLNIRGADGVLRFHEYGSKTATGLTMDLASRSLSPLTPGEGSDDYVLTATQAAEYTIENMFGNTAAYDPREYTKQVDLDGVVLTQSDAGITWNGNKQAICYFIFRQNTETGNFEFFDICQDEVYMPRDSANADGMIFYVRAANERGGLGKPSNTIKYKKLGWYDLKVVHKEGLAETGNTSDDWKGWGTICLARNAKVPTQSINEDGTLGKGEISVYAAQAKIDGTTIHMKKVEYLRAGCGYVVYATTGETEKTYRFNYTWDTNNVTSGANDSFLDGNELDDTVSVGTVNCYTMAYKKTINPDCVGFYKFIGEKIPPHRAYLTVETAAAKGFVLDTEADAKKVRFVFDDSDEEFFFYEGDEDADGIRNVRSSEVDPEAVFDLSGKRLDKSQLRKGMVYVIGGKKVLWNGE